MNELAHRYNENDQYLLWKCMRVVRSVLSPAVILGLIIPRSYLVGEFSLYYGVT